MGRRRLDGQSRDHIGKYQRGVSKNGRGKVTQDVIEFVHCLIERCLCKYMTKKEVVDTLSARVNIEPDLTRYVWRILQEDNPEFFRFYYIKLELKKQIKEFNQLLVQQYHYASDVKPFHNNYDNLPVNFFSGNSTDHLPSMAATHMDTSVYGSSYHTFNGVSTAGCSHPTQQNVGVSSDNLVMGKYSNGVLSYELGETLNQSAQPTTFNSATLSNLGFAEEFQLDMHDGSRNPCENLSPHYSQTPDSTNSKGSSVIVSFADGDETVQVVLSDDCDMGNDLMVNTTMHKAQSGIDAENMYMGC